MLGHYVYNASAIGLGGVLASPQRKVIPSLASVALAPTGGEGSSLVRNYNEDGVTFDSAETTVWGSNDGDNVYSTRAEVQINKLNLFNQLKVESMWASVTSIREVLEDGTVLDRRFTFQAEYIGVRLNDQVIDVPVDCAIFENNPSYTEFTNAIAAPEMCDYRTLIGMSDEQADELVRSCQSPQPRTICCTAISPRLNSIHLDLPGKGRAHLAEALVKPGRRRLTLLRLELDPPTEETIGQLQPRGFAVTTLGGSSGPGGGSMTVGSVEGNGTNTWP